MKKSTGHRSSHVWAWALSALVPVVLLAAPTAPGTAPPSGGSQMALGRPPTLTRRAWTTDQGLPDNWVKAIAQTRDGYLWVGTQGGLARFDGVRFVVFDQRTRPDWTSEDISALCASRDGDLWIGTLDGGLLRFSGGAFTHVRLPSPTVRALHEARDGTVWIAMDRGLARMRQGGSPKVFEMFAATYVYGFHEDPDGGMWLGTPRGLVHFRERPLIVYTTANGLGGDHITALYRESGGPLWVGTARGGLTRFEHDRFTNYGPAQGLCDDQVLAVLDDGLGNLWMSSSRGVFHVAKQQLNDVALGTRTTVSCTAYGRADGMESAQCNGGYQPSGWRARDGISAWSPISIRLHGSMPRACSWQPPGPGVCTRSVSATFA
jgi:ligand-binding sensor domain-containing protein